MKQIEQKKYFDTADDQPRVRLDVFLTQNCIDINRNRMKKLIIQGYAYIDQVQCKKPDKIIKDNMQITLSIPAVEPTVIKAQAIELDVICENQDMIIINKPAAMVVHPARGNRDGTLVNALLQHCGSNLSGINGVAKPGIVHRLDKNTSGVMAVAKNDRTHQILARQFEQKKYIKKIYCATIWGEPPLNEGIIDKPIAKSKSNPLKQAIRLSGKKSITQYKTIAVMKSPENDEVIASALLLRIMTGRTHQIRVHLRNIGCPVIADELYGTDFATKRFKMSPAIRKDIEKIDRHLLHALALGVIIEKKEQIFFAKMPKDMREIMQSMFGQNIEQLLIGKAKETYFDVATD